MYNVRLVYKWKLVLLYRIDMIAFLNYVIKQNHHYMQTRLIEKEFKRKKKLKWMSRRANLEIKEIASKYKSC
jgi:hypothetical protein